MSKLILATGIQLLIYTPVCTIYEIRLKWTERKHAKHIGNCCSPHLQWNKGFQMWLLSQSVSQSVQGALLSKWNNGAPLSFLTNWLNTQNQLNRETAQLRNVSTCHIICIIRKNYMCTTEMFSIKMHFCFIKQLSILVLLNISQSTSELQLLQD